MNSTEFELLPPGLITRLTEASAVAWATAATGVVLYLILNAWLNQPKLVTNARYAGYRSWFEPTLLLRLRWSWDAKRIMTEGYKQSNNETPFVVRRWDRDITILPQKHLQQIRTIPNTKLNAQMINIVNQAADYTGLTFVMNNNILFRALTNKLTSDLPRFIDSSKTVLDWAAPIELPPSTEWNTVGIEHATRMIFARLSTNMSIGGDATHDVEWCEQAAMVSYNTMTVGLVFKKTPSWTHPILARVLPMVHNLRKSHARCTDLLTPPIERWRAGLSTPKDKQTLLYWMLEHAREDEKTPFEMAYRVNAIIIASVHTNGMTLTSILFNLCARPEYFSILRKEIGEVTKKLGPMGAAGPETLQKQWLASLEKMDSFISETLRVNPPILGSPNRVAMEDITLQDGTHIPKGTWITFPSDNIMKDPSNYPDPETFDGLRNYHKRQALAEAASSHLATQATPSELSFGYGNRACPGRFFAVSVLKMVLTKILLEYDVQYAGNKNPYDKMEEFSFVAMDAELMLRRKANVA